ncbi:MAG: AMP-binding protein, partial [Mycobacterium sp.]|nr:AMP-binding protein [Mycobacterium sp.]
MELDGGRPLTRGQLDIWLAQEAALAGTDWQLGLLGRIAGRVDRDHLHDAIRLVVREAEPGRAAFFVTAGQILQRAIDYPDVQLDFYDLTGSEDTAREVGEIASSIRRKPMPLAGPLFKFALFQTSPDEFYLFACCHHIAMDGLGMVLVSRRIAAIYSALVAGEPVPPSYFGSLNDLVEEESAYEASPDYLEDRNYWSTHLPPDNSAHYWPSEFAKGDDSSAPSLPIPLDPSVVGQAKELSKKLRIRRYSVFTAACALLVGGYSATDEVALNFPVSRRVTQKSKTLPGMLAGVLPLVIKTPARLSAAEFCRDVDSRIRELLQHQRFPMQALESRTFGGPRLEANRVAINFIPSRLTLDFGGAQATASYTNLGPVGHFGLFFLGSGDELSLSTAGLGEPFASIGVTDLVERIQRIVAAMAADPGRRLSGIDVLDDVEHAQLDGWGNRAALSEPAPVRVSVPEVFAEQVVRAPGAVAVRFGGQSMTYAELDAASNRLAHYLVDRGVGPGRCVGLLLPRSAQAITAIVAILKSGATYVPIDAAHPDERIAFVLADAAAAVVITDAQLRSRVVGHDLAIVDVEDEGIAAQPSTPLPFPAPDDIAYVIYTSGTTGTPKGVAITHHNLARLMQSRPAGLAAGQVWTQCHSLAFDFSVWEIFGALLHG